MGKKLCKSFRKRVKKIKAAGKCGLLVEKTKTTTTTTSIKTAGSPATITVAVTVLRKITKSVKAIRVIAGPRRSPSRPQPPPHQPSSPIPAG